jgi:hypothetical protein
MFDSGFAHYLSYGATDQQTVRDLVGDYDGLLVPGTVAAFQREGTGGFVLALSATALAPQYAIDPRFPLFQQRLTNPKKSHLALAELLGIPELVRSREPTPDDFTDSVVERIATNWAQFNGDYRAAAGSKFAKYARRLGQEVRPRDARAPSYVLPPYLVARSPADPWWPISARLYDATRDALNGDGRCVRVVAASSSASLSGLLDAIAENRAAVWVSGLEEHASPVEVLRSYAQAVAHAQSGGLELFALYGGFFSVLLQNVGLSGSSHGIGYGEYRRWIELPESGPPPARYYLAQLHRYVQPDEAARLYFADRRLAECKCEECNGEPPLGLDYHALMRHSVRCRAFEISDWAGLDSGKMAARLRLELKEYKGVLHASELPEVAVARIERQAVHITVWADALDGL